MPLRRALLARPKREKTVPSSHAGMPMPRSLMAIVALPSPPVTRTSTSSCEYLSAFISRLSSTWLKRAGSSETGTGSAGRSRRVIRASPRLCAFTLSATNSRKSTPFAIQRKAAGLRLRERDRVFGKAHEALGLRVDRFEFFAQLCGRILQQQFAVSQDDRERTFEIVREHREQIVFELVTLRERASELLDALETERARKGQFQMRGEHVKIDAPLGILPIVNARSGREHDEAPQLAVDAQRREQSFIRAEEFCAQLFGQRGALHDVFALEQRDEHALRRRVRQHRRAPNPPRAPRGASRRHAFELVHRARQFRLRAKP